MILNPNLVTILGVSYNFASKILFKEIEIDEDKARKAISYIEDAEDKYSRFENVDFSKPSTAVSPVLSLLKDYVRDISKVDKKISETPSPIDWGKFITERFSYPTTFTTQEYQVYENAISCIPGLSRIGFSQDSEESMLSIKMYADSNLDEYVIRDCFGNIEESTSKENEMLCFLPEILSLKSGLTKRYYKSSNEVSDKEKTKLKDGLVEFIEKEKFREHVEKLRKNSSNTRVKFLLVRNNLKMMISQENKYGKATLAHITHIEDFIINIEDFSIEGFFSFIKPASDGEEPVYYCTGIWNKTDVPGEFESASIMTSDVAQAAYDMMWREIKSDHFYFEPMPDAEGLVSFSHSWSEEELVETPVIKKNVDILNKLYDSNKGFKVIINGKPGFGKSCLLKFFSRKKDRVAFINLENFDVYKLESFLWNARPNIVIMDDIDRLGKALNKPYMLSFFEENLCERYDLKMVLMTSNNYSKIPIALRRPGRIDMILEFESPKDKEEIQELVRNLVGKKEDSSDFTESDIDYMGEVYRAYGTAGLVEFARRIEIFGDGYRPDIDDQTFILTGKTDEEITSFYDALAQRSDDEVFVSDEAMFEEAMEGTTRLDDDHKKLNEELMKAIFNSFK